MNMNKLDGLESYKLFRTNEIRENGSYTDINSLVNQSVVDYEAGYTDQQNTLTQYKEALRELVEDIENNLLTREREFIETGLAKAKQLLNNE